MPTALVTGARSELGAAYARELAERGYSVVLVADDAGYLAATAERIGRATGAIVEPLVAALADPAGAAAVERRIAVPDVPVELLVNVADGGHAGTGRAAAERLTRAAVAAMTARGRGGILVVDPDGDERAAARGRVRVAAAGPGGAGEVTVTTVHTGRGRAGAGPAVQTVVRRSLADLARGRTSSVPGRVHRTLADCLEPPRSAVRRVASAAGRGRRAPLDRAAVPGAGRTRPSPVPTPFRDGPRPVRAVPAGAAAETVLPELPVRPPHVAESFPVPRISGTGNLPATPPRAARAAGEGRAVPTRAGRDGVRRLPARPRPVQRPVHDPATVRTVAG